MASPLQGRGALVVLAVAAVAVVGGLLSALNWNTLRLTPAQPPASTSAAAPSAPGTSSGGVNRVEAPPAAPGATAIVPPQSPSQTEAQASAPSAPESATPPAANAPPSVVAALPPPGAPVAPAAPAPPAAPQSSSELVRDEAGTPSFDIVRVEPNGESVIAGRGVPGATIEMLRDGQVHARGVADGSGLFALVPPALSPGSHQITLQSNAPDGTRQRSRDSVTVVVSEGRNTPPLVALTAPDKPTVILSNPEPPQRTAQAEPGTPPVGGAAPGTPQPQQQASLPPGNQPPARRTEVRIASVEAEDGGRLFVSGEAVPGSTVRLYLNDTLIAPGGVGADGRVSFVIGRGVRPGDYRVRLDVVDPASGSVKSRAEVVFNVPPSVVVALPPQASTATAPPQIAGSPPSPPAPRSSGVEPPRTAAGPASPGPQVAAIPPDPSSSRRATTAAPGTRPTPSPATRATPMPAGPTASPSERIAAQPDAAGRQGSSPNPEPRDLPAGTVVIPDLNTAIVSRGDNLWRISQRIYGRGVRYTVIFGANQPQIRNPNLIYPGQVFVLPPEQEPQAQ